MKRANTTTFLSHRSATLLGLLLLTGCSCFKSHEESCGYSQYTRGLDDTPMVGMAELGILMRETDKLHANTQNPMRKEMLEESVRVREAICSKAEFDEQVRIFNEVLNRRIDGYKKGNEVYLHRLVPCVAPHFENQPATNINGAVK